MPPARALWLLLSGYAVSSYGNYLNLVALGLFSFHWTQSTWATGAPCHSHPPHGQLPGPCPAIAGPGAKGALRRLMNRCQP
jgi:hypothetical protein